MIKLTLSGFQSKQFRLIEGRRKRWALAGEWFGSKYVDYIAQRLEKDEANTTR